MFVNNYILLKNKDWLVFIFLFQNKLLCLKTKKIINLKLEKEK